MKDNKTLIMVKDFIIELKGQMKENKRDYKINIKGEYLADAMHLYIVNETLENVIHELQDIVAASKPD